MGYPQNVTLCDSSGNMSRADAQIVRLAHAHRALLEEKIKNEAAVPVLSAKQRFETFLSSHKGILSLIGILVAIVLGGLKLLLG
jgi:Na+/alanine symporter